MASRPERQVHLEKMTEDEFKAFSHKWGGDFMRKQGDARIKWLLDDAENHGDAFDIALGLPTEQDRQRKLDDDMLALADKNTRINRVLAAAAVASVAISILALIVALTK